MKIYGKENIKYDSEKIVAEWLESYDVSKAKHKFDFAIASKEFVIASDEDIEIDFILVGTAGVLVLEVKGGNVAINDGIWQSNKHVLPEDPFKQARRHFYGLWELINSNTSVKNTVGYYAVAFPGISINKPLDATYPMAMYFDSRFGQAPEKFIDGVIELSHQQHGAKSLSSAKVKEIKELLVPNYNDYITDLTTSNDEKILKLSEEQLIVLAGLVDVKRMVIQGPPGSGKTILAVEQAIQNEKNEIKTLFVCYNRTLANKLRAILLSRIGHEPKYVIFETLTYIKSHIKERDFEYLIADEAQDYMNDEGVLALDDYMLGGLDNCRFRIFCDQNQDLYRSINYLFLNELLNRDDVVVYSLNYNYRNTAHIIVYANILSSLSCGNIRNNPIGERPNLIPIPYISDGKVDWDEYTVSISKTINSLIDEGYLPGDIAIVTNMQMYKSVLRDTDDIRIKNGIKLIHCTDVKWNNDLNKQGIIYGSVYELKGIDSKVAIVIDAFKSSAVSETLVSLTRARSKLIVFHGSHFSNHY